ALAANEKLMAYPTKEGFGVFSLANKKTSYKTSSKESIPMALSPQGELLALYFHSEEKIEIINTENGETVRSRTWDWVKNVRFENKESLIVGGRRFIRWNLKDGATETLYDYPGWILAQCPKTGFFAFGRGSGGYVAIFDPKGKKIVCFFRTQTLPVTN